MKKYVQVSFTLLLVTLLFGCATYTYTDAPSVGSLHSKYIQIGYEGELKALEDVGIVTTDGIVHINSISIDNKKIDPLKSFHKDGFYSMGRYQLHLNPGTYILSLSFSSTDGYSTTDVMKLITIKNGQVIHLSWLNNGRSKWSVKESDGIAALATIREDFIELTKAK